MVTCCDRIKIQQEILKTENMKQRVDLEQQPLQLSVRRVKSPGELQEGSPAVGKRILAMGLTELCDWD